MARTDYFAPGVYVEEIPSAQQPSAGVGTNTAAFIGVVPDVIEYPVPNEQYDPQLARKAVAGPDQEAIDKLNKDIEGLELDKKQIAEAIKKIDEQLASKPLSKSKEEGLENQKKAKQGNLKAIDDDIKAKKDDIKALKNPPEVDPAILKPYEMKEFDVDANVKSGVAKLCTNFFRIYQAFWFILRGRLREQQRACGTFTRTPSLNPCCIRVFSKTEGRDVL